MAVTIKPTLALLSPNPNPNPDRKSKDPASCEGLPCPTRQRAFRELGFVKLLIECLLAPFCAGHPEASQKQIVA